MRIHVHVSSCVSSWGGVGQFGVDTRPGEKRDLARDAGAPRLKNPFRFPSVALEGILTTDG